MTKINRETLIGGLGIAATALVYFLTRKNESIFVSGQNTPSPMQTIQAGAAQPSSILIPPAPPNYLTYNFGPSHDLTKIAPDNTPLEVYSQGPQTVTDSGTFPNIAPARSSNSTAPDSGCGCGCDDKCSAAKSKSFQVVATQSMPASVVISQYSNVMGVINRQQNYSAIIG